MGRIETKHFIPKIPNPGNILTNTKTFFKIPKLFCVKLLNCKPQNIDYKWSVFVPEIL